MYTPQIESILEELATQCCSVIADGRSPDRRRIDELTASLSTNGWQRHSRGGTTLREQLARRIKVRVPAQAIHRGREITSLVETVVDSYQTASFGASAPTAETVQHG
ncbi:MAG: hypothetical protein Aurels2KO_50610 [Aureliella sp.]